LGIRGIKGLGIDFHPCYGPVAFRGYFYGAAATGRFDCAIGQILLDLCHILLHALRLFNDLVQICHG